MSTIKLFLLGSPRLERDGLPLELQYRKNIALLAYLAVTGEWHTREALMALLWPELERSRARANLRRNLSLLRQALGGDVLAVEGDSIGLDADADLWLDVDAFRRLLSSRQGHGHPEAEICPECLVALAEAVELYRGDFLEGFGLPDSLAFDDWQFFQSEGLRQDLASALERLVRGHSAQGAYESAIPYARRWLGLDPLHEPAQRHLMQLYAQTGQRAAALRQYQECARVLEAELGLSPSRETRSLYEHIRTQPADREVPFVPAPPAQHNLPAPTTPFVGRERELAEIAALLQAPDYRLLSLVGPGGIGKSRLTLEAAREQAGRYEDGVYWVSLAAVPTIDGMVSAVAQTIGLALYRASDPWQRLLDHLRNKRMLLILDSLEHLLDTMSPTGRGAVDLVKGMLQAAPEARIVVTSRVRPNVQSEHLVPVAGMEYPREDWGIGEQGIGDRREPEAKDATKYSAVRLFLSHARRVRPGFEPTAEQLADIAQVCRLVQGMPLAILLAAAWMEMLSPAEIVAELEQGYDLLEADLRDLPERQRSIEAVFDASWRMLDDAEREAFARLSVFRGGFTRDAAQEVAGAGLRTLISLVQKSFLQRDAAGRFEIHELLRQYAEHKLAEIPEEKERTSDLHCHYYVQALRREMAGMGWDKDQGGVLLKLDNLRAGWHWAVSQARFAEACGYIDMFHLHCTRGWYQEAISSLEWAADVLRTRCARDGVSREGSVALGLIQIRQGYMYQAYDPSRRVEMRDKLVEEGVSALRRVGARRELAGSASWVAYAYSPKRDAEAWQVVEESLAFYQEMGDLEGIARMLGVLGELSVRRRAYDEAERYCQEAISLGEKLDNRGAISHPPFVLAKVAYHRGEYSSARQFYEDTLPRVEKGGQKNYIGMLTSFLGDTALTMGDYARARKCHLRARALYKEMTVHWGEVASGEHYGVAYSLDRLGDVALALGDIEEARRTYRQALEIARDHPQVALHLDVVVSQTALLAREGHGEQAVELAALALHHPASGPEVEGRAQKLIEQGEARLPPDVITAAKERGRTQDLETATAELFAQLDE